MGNADEVKISEDEGGRSLPPIALLVRRLLLVRTSLHVPAPGGYLLQIHTDVFARVEPGLSKFIYLADLLTD